MMCNIISLVSIINLFLLPLLFYGVVLLPQHTAASHSTVQFLPGFEGRLPFHLETGYIGVGEYEEVQLFYYFLKSESEPTKDPVLVWLSGGPGCSSFTALVYQIGPLYFEPNKYNGSLPKLTLNPNSWTKVANIIFLDQPVNSGFSYATTSTTFKSTDLQACDHIYLFLRKWLIKHPEFIRNPMYIGGDSYSGITLPVITQLISNGIEAGHKPSINLKGYILGNPSTFPLQYNYWIPYAHGMGLISDELYKLLKETCNGENLQYVDPSNVLCYQHYQTFEQLISGINKPHILEPSCGSDAESRLFGERRSLYENYSIKCRVEVHRLSTYWANDPRVQEALNVRKGAIERWTRCRESIVNKTYIITFQDSIPYHVELSKKLYRSLIYSGDHDMGIPFQSTQFWIKFLNYSIVDEWRPWIVDDQVAGYTRSYSNQMTFATVKGAGHVAPEYKPKECFTMFHRWLSHEQL
ncbi:serine carboxypeptidase-like 13 [Nicotiana tabacum]|uniref:Serine carboxypeptidase-like 13 n=1 Tax=Nicotiana tabacum TaxID=4097 RepID=A0A1S3YQE6_TOBAC|nr:serine carboxypeptidase-like 13 isoform X1 [Nicotiana tomentosiformis]XP_016454358.1 PREDICTED: serine carboxypeptidase-like 13 [Nicotiana tabacum]